MFELFNHFFFKFSKLDDWIDKLFFFDGKFKLQFIFSILTIL